MLKLISPLSSYLLTQAESGMGYQNVQATMEDNKTKRGVVFNSEILLFDDEPYADLARHFRSFSDYGTAVQLLRSSLMEVRTVQVISPTEIHQPTSVARESSAEYAKKTGG